MEDQGPPPHHEDLQCMYVCMYRATFWFWDGDVYEVRVGIYGVKVRNGTWTLAYSLGYRQDTKHQTDTLLLARSEGSPVRLGLLLVPLHSSMQACSTCRLFGGIIQETDLWGDKNGSQVGRSFVLLC
jgi:hypothetical protein